MDWLRNFMREKFSKALESGPTGAVRPLKPKPVDLKCNIAAAPATPVAPKKEYGETDATRFVNRTRLLAKLALSDRNVMKSRRQRQHHQSWFVGDLPERPVQAIDYQRLIDIALRRDEGNDKKKE
jgi:hypothetical protein